MSKATAEYIATRATDLKTKSTAAFDIAIKPGGQEGRSIQGTVSDAKRLLNNISDVLQPHLPSSRALSLAECARHTVNIILKILVNLTERPILDDRTCIVDFGNVPKLDLWQKGLIRSHFSTQKVMSLVCGRDATVMTDRAYCLMGMLGTRSLFLRTMFLFSTGPENKMGRSLYPSSPEAFKFDKNAKCKKQKAQKLAALLQIERYEVMSDFLAISGMLEILKVIKRAKFEQFKPHITNIVKILKYIETAFDSVSSTEPQATASPCMSDPVVDDTTSDLSIPLSPSFSSLSSQFKAPSLPKDMPSFKAPKFARKKTEPETPTTEPEARSIPPTPTTPSLIASDVPKLSLNEQVLRYISSIQAADENEDEEGKPATSEPELPPDLEKVLAGIPARELSKPPVEPEEIDIMISPNPIIIKNSGIEGLFDIQRVVISMAQPEKLRRQIRNPIRPHQKITGWCIISTGFARVMVSFSSPKHILEKELDIVQAVESKVLNAKSPEGEPDGNANVTGEGPPKGSHSGVQATGSTWQKMVTAKFNAPEPTKKDDENDMENPGSEKMKSEGARMSRIIKFVQESDLTEIAGEWVLARFSGVPGAKWFLCYLELGGSGRDFYGHRIVTDEIDFHNASPEMGLIKYWEYYMMQKKYRLCSILQKLMESKDWENFKAEMGQNIVKRVAEETGVSGQEDDFGGDSDDESGDGKISDTLKELDGMALRMTGAGLAQQFYEWQAERLQKNLSADVLKKFPTHANRPK
ncbi:uncharacterized protein F4807DRAFT_465038 [Annulohypoxylon truncatum]|uniref:uncharacterized protein n=1 Tax=Annulohypoxylon truncatum TaxID=327061 RepID=UPI0020082F25|nr:uncharacterized protein F4807DRAFT_465038 [Annulohypoxylon truncatum]KAI1205068.1 hypothetical protein F4807DRAFT_465038 [Annulohypoxylon truncatum]